MRELIFKRYFKHYKTGEIIHHLWGFINDDGNRSFTGPGSISGYEVIADCQYTGLKDRNGERIFEGDELVSDDGRRFIMKWFQTSWMLESDPFTKGEKRWVESSESKILMSAEKYSLCSKLELTGRNIHDERW